jgi:hypothetical protein
MTITEQQTRILAAIADRGWITNELYFEAARELCARGQIKLSTRRTAVGATKFVWEAAQ